jgi:hypothetical protein
VELEHLKIETRLTIDKFASEIGDVRKEKKEKRKMKIHK